MSAVAARSLSVIVTTSSIVAAYHGHTGTDNDKTESFQNINVVGSHDTTILCSQLLFKRAASRSAFAVVIFGKHTLKKPGK